MTHGSPPPAFNGTVADEREVLGACLGCLHVGAGQVVRSLTTSGSRGGANGERMLSYLRGNPPGLGEEALADFLTKNRERHPVEPDFDPEGRLV